MPASPTPPAGVGERGASRSDPRTGVLERAAFLPHEGGEVFAVRHVPPEPRGGVVVCCPIESEMEVNYRREVLLARALAERGVAVVRFHYRGAGHSQGEQADMGFDTMRDDARVAVEWLAGEAGVTDLGFLGTRLGALVAASLASEVPGAPLALWEPVLDAKRYFREIFRTPMILALKDGEAAGRPDRPPTEGLRERGLLDIVGYPIHVRLYESFATLRLGQVLGEAEREILLVQLGSAKALRREYRALVDGWHDRGFGIRSQALPVRTAWWLEGSDWLPEDLRSSTKTLVEDTADWFVGALGKGRT